MPANKLHTVTHVLTLGRDTGGEEEEEEEELCLRVKTRIVCKLTGRRPNAVARGRMLVYIKRLLAAGLDELPIKNNARGKLILANRFRSQASFVAQEEQDQQNVIAGGHETITVDLRPNAYSVCGSICTLVFLCLLGGTSFSRFLVQEPTITSELVQASLSNTSHWLPDLAMTISTAFSEEDMLDFVWPEFRWYEIRDGFTGGIQFSRTLMPESEVRFGQDGCSLAVGYERQSSGTETTYTSDAGRKWPVFCVLNSTKKLQGRFGDPKWDYLNVDAARCDGCVQPGSTTCVAGSPACRRPSVALFPPFP